VAVAAAVASPLSGGASQADAPREVPKEVRALVGTYTGSWTLYGIDGQGAVVKRMTWTDTLKTRATEVKGDRAYVTWTNEQTFEGPRGTPRKVEGKEGYLLTKDGALGDYFVEMHGQTTRMVRLGDNVWTGTLPASAPELAGLGFPRGASGQHVVVKVVTKEQGVETHRISRLSTVTWTDKDGKEHVLQFVSLQGYHKRQL
jgi:hypothetical protein